MARKINRKKSQLNAKLRYKVKQRLSFTNCSDLRLDMDQPSSSTANPGIPQSSDAQKTCEVSEIVGIPVLNLETIVVDDGIKQPVVFEQPEVSEDATEWIEVTGKKSKSPQTSTQASGSILRFTAEDVADEVKYWDTVVVCYVLGSNPPWELLEGFVKKLWGVYKFDKISFLPNGVFLVRFPNKECQSLVLQQGFPMCDNKPLIVKPWTEDCSLCKEKVQFVPIWLRLCGLPLMFWGKTCLEKLAGLLGKFLKRDGATEDKTRLGYARLLVEVKIGQNFPDKLMFQDEKGQDITILVEYE
ncbi:uncharacterized protein LOC141620457 [Silene latifolia]|uniref:uncharacterized protein LOC141620457 n=1 Tax=Silene latifolia TaxID=37657 RepID=UPI003D76CFD1